MANFGTEPVRPQQDAQTAVREVRQLDVGQIARDYEGRQDAVKNALDLSDKLVALKHQNQYNEQVQTVRRNMDSLETTITQDPTNAPDAPAHYAEGYAKLKLGIDGLSVADEVKQALHQTADELYTTGLTDVQKYQHVQNIQQSVQHAGNAAQSIVDTTYQKSPTGPALILAHQAIADTYNHLSDPKVNLLTPEDGATLAKAAHASLDVESAKYQVATNPGLALKYLQGGIYQNLGSKKPELIEAAKAKIKEEQTQADDGASYTAKTLLANVWNGAPVSASIVQQTAAMLKPGPRAEFLSDLKAGQETAITIQSLPSKSLADQQALVNQMAAGTDRYDPNAIANNKKLAAVSDAVNANLAQAKKDPSGYIMQSPAVQAVINQKGFDPTHPHMMQQLIDARKAAYEQAGIKGPLIPPALLANMKDAYIQADSKKSMQMLQNYPSLFGGDYRDVRSELADPKHGLPASFNLYEQGMSIQELSQFKAVDTVPVKALAKAVNDINNSDVTATSIDKSIASTYSRIAPALGAAGHQPLFFQTMQKLAYNNVLQGQDPDTAVQNAAETVFGRYTFSGRWMYPTGTSEDEQQRIQQYGSDVISKTRLQGYDRDFAENTTEPINRAGDKERAALKALNHWQFIPDKNTYVLLNGQGAMVKQPTGRPVSFRLSDVPAAPALPSVEDASGENYQEQY